MISSPSASWDSFWDRDRRDGDLVIISPVSMIMIIMMMMIMMIAVDCKYNVISDSAFSLRGEGDNTNISIKDVWLIFQTICSILVYQFVVSYWIVRCDTPETRTIITGCWIHNHSLHVNSSIAIVWNCPDIILVSHGDGHEVSHGVNFRVSHGFGRGVRHRVSHGPGHMVGHGVGSVMGLLSSCLMSQKSLVVSKL